MTRVKPSVGHRQKAVVGKDETGGQKAGDRRLIGLVLFGRQRNWADHSVTTRRCGDRHGVTAKPCHRAVHGATVALLSAVSVLFFRGREPGGAGDRVAAVISQPGGAELSHQRVQARRPCASGNFGSCSGGLGGTRA